MTNKYLINQMPAQCSKEIVEMFMDVEPATVGHNRFWGFCHKDIRPMIRGKHIVGTAVTLSIPGPDSTLLHHAADLLRPGDVLVIDRLGDDKYACWGGGVTLAVKNSGAVAGVIDGPCTDLAEIEEANLPVWARGVTAITTRAYDLGGRINIPVAIGGTVVMPGDVIVADECGVMVIPQEEAYFEAKRALDLQALLRVSETALRNNEVKLGVVSGSSEKIMKHF